MIGIRGAIRIDRNDRSAVYRGTQRLLDEIMDRNELEESSIVSAFFTMTPDLNADFPAYAARQLGWTDIPMLGAQETAVPGALDRIVRVLLHADVPGPARHVYLGEAAAMRPDLVEEGDATPDLEASAASPAEFGPVLVVGLGLIGGSVALAVRRAGLFSEVLGHDRAAYNLERARRAGAIDRGSHQPEELIGRASAVVLAIPVTAIRRWLHDWGDRLPRGTVVVDVGSTKREIVAAMEELPAGVEAVGAHPMAGTEESGMGAARPDLFHGARWAIVETGRTGERSRALVRRLVDAVGGVPVWMNAAAHDATVARTSHLPYLTSVALARTVTGRSGRVNEREIRALVGPGLRDMTRLANSDPQLMAEILVSNWEEIRGAVREFQEALTSVVQEIETATSGDIDGVRAMEDITRLLENGRKARRTMMTGQVDGDASSDQSSMT